MLAMLTCGISNVLARDSKPKKPSYRTFREGMFALTKFDSVKIVMLGDSITAAAQWNEITGCPSLANRGISGDDSAGVLQRLDEVIKLKPAAVFFMIGINDLHANVPPETIAENVRLTVQKLSKAGAHVLLTFTLPVVQHYARKLNSKVDELNAAYKRVARQLDVNLVDLRDKVSTESGALRNELSTDGLHLTAEGYRVWRDAIAPLVEKYCASS
jgi:lysophospholipase L1-like esterase